MPDTKGPDSAAPDTEISDENLPVYFAFFNEIGILAQLSRAMVEARLPFGFVMMHFTVLNHLTRVADGRTPLAIASALQVPKTSLTHTLSGLEERGLIEMRPNPRDGRSKLVWLTDAGRQFRLNTVRNVEPDFRIFAEAFPPEHLSELLPRLTEIREYLDKMRD